MSTTSKHVPMHRTEHARTPAVLRGVRRGVVAAACVASAAVLLAAPGVVPDATDPGGRAAADSGPARLAALSTVDSGRSAGVSAADLGDRAPVVSRGDRRDATDPAKEKALRAADAPAMTAAENVVDRDPRSIARSMMGEFGFSGAEFGCLDSLWTKESGWDVHADNPTSSAYGIPQSLPGEKMAAAGADWADNPATQIRWGLGYIRDSYGSPCSAWSHSQSVDWY